MENIEKRGCSKVWIIVLLIVVLGLAGYIGYDKFFNKKCSDCEKELKELKNKKCIDEKKEESKEEDTAKTDDSKYTEKAYKDGSGATIVLFKSGSCIVAGANEYTPDCTYYIENNKVLLTRAATGPSDGSKKTYTYSIITEGSEEYLQIDGDQNSRFKCLKK